MDDPHAHATERSGPSADKPETEKPDKSHLVAAALWISGGLILAFFMFMK